MEPFKVDGILCSFKSDIVSMILRVVLLVASISDVWWEEE